MDITDNPADQAIVPDPGSIASNASNSAANLFTAGGGFGSSGTGTSGGGGGPMIPTEDLFKPPPASPTTTGTGGTTAGNNLVNDPALKGLFGNGNSQTNTSLASQFSGDTGGPVTLTPDQQAEAAATAAGGGTSGSMNTTGVNPTLGGYGNQQQIAAGGGAAATGNAPDGAVVVTLNDGTTWKIDPVNGDLTPYSGSTLNAQQAQQQAQAQSQVPATGGSGSGGAGADNDGFANVNSGKPKNTPATPTPTSTPTPAAAPAAASAPAGFNSTAAGMNADDHSLATAAGLNTNNVVGVKTLDNGQKVFAMANGDEIQVNSSPMTIDPKTGKPVDPAAPPRYSAYKVKSHSPVNKNALPPPAA